ncbi:hypothetical protein ACFQ60_40415 [Streptomyces zhihengii]
MTALDARPDTTTHRFPAAFRWGTATAAYQIEEPPPRTAVPRRSGTRSAAPRARSATVTRATSRPTTTTG